MISNCLKYNRRIFGLWLPIAAFVLALAACGSGAPDFAYYHEEHSHHVHTPLFGGQLVEIGDHFANIEVLFDSDTGALTIYTLDAHADYVQRVEQPVLELLITAENAESPITLRLPAIADPLSGETIGDSSKFETVAPELVGLESFNAVIRSLDIRGGQFEDIAFEYPSHHHHH